MAVRYDHKARQIAFFRTLDNKEVATLATEVLWDELITLPNAFTGISEEALRMTDGAALKALQALV